MPKPPATWKSWERKIPKYLDPDGERTHWAPEDARALGYKIEVKHGNWVPKTLLKWWEQAVRNAVDAKPLLVIHPPNFKLEDCLVILSLKEFKEIKDMQNT